MLEPLLKELAPAQIVPVDLSACIVMDLTAENRELAKIDPADTKAFNAYVEAAARSQGKQYSIGRYQEDRCIYRMSELFSGDEQPRSIHIGLDIWVPSGTPVLAAYDGQVHSFQDNANFGDYGPTIIVSHWTKGVSWHTLYGHLTRESLLNLAVGTEVRRGDMIARVGESHENGNWPSHLHFQIIRNMGEWRGDYPGVCSPEDREYYLENCPDPNLLLGLAALRN